MTRRPIAGATSLVAALALALGTVACGNDDDGDGATVTDPPPPVTDATDDDGVLVTSPDSDFTIVFPGEPVTDSVEVPVEAGQTVTTEIFAYETADGDALLASWVDYPDDFDSSDSEAVLTGARDGSLENVAGELVESEFITLDGRPGVAYRADVEMMGVSGVYLARTFIDDTRLYQIVAIGTVDTGFEPVGEAFLDSFQFTGEAR